MDARLKRYYRKKMYGGRSIVARAVDFIMLRAAIVVTLFIIMLQLSHSLLVSAAVSLLITTAVSLAMHLYRKNKADNFFEKDLLRIQKKCLLESLTIMNLQEYIAWMTRIFPKITNVSASNGYFCADYEVDKMIVLHNHPSSSVSVSQTVDAYRLVKNSNKSVMISLSDYSKDAKKFAESVSMVLVNGQELLRFAGEKGLMLDEHSAEKRAREEMEESIITMESVRRSAFSRTKVKAYIFCGIVAMIWPLLGIWRFYYPIISIVCFALAFISFKKGKHAQENAGIDLT